MSRTPTANIDYTSRDYLAYKELLIEKLKEKMPEYTDTSETDAGIVILEALANGLDILSLYSDIMVNDMILPTTQSRSMAVIISSILGYYPFNQTASQYQQVFVLSGVRDVDTFIPKGTQISTVETLDLDTLYFETMKDLIIPAGKLGNEQSEDGYLYTVPIHSGVSIREDVIGSSSGSPLQNFALSYENVLVDSIELYVDEGEGPILWKRVNNFIESNFDSRNYTATVDDFNVCTIHFGNGIRGKIPLAYPNGIIANYRVGGGDISNVNANIITELVTNIPYVTETFNLPVEIRGHDRESLESIKTNAPASFKARDRMVTLEDYEDLLRIGFYEIMDAKAIQDGESKKLVHIYYMLKEHFIMTDYLREKLSAYISDKSMVGTTFDLNPYVSQKVDLEAKLYVDKDYNKTALEDKVRTYIQQVIFKYGEIKFDDYIVKSDIETEIKKNFSGIIAFRITNNPEEDIIAPTESQNVLELDNLTIQSYYI